jgi:hypothetical protein
MRQEPTSLSRAVILVASVLGAIIGAAVAVGTQSENFVWAVAGAMTFGIISALNILRRKLRKPSNDT